MNKEIERICKYCGYVITAPKKRVYCSIRCGQDDSMMNHLIRKRTRLQAEAIAPESEIKSSSQGPETI